MIYKLPYDFVLRNLYPIRPKIKKMLGCYALLMENKILFLLRERDNQPEFNGVFIATKPEYYDELQQEIHTSSMEFNLDGLHHSYLFLSEDLDDFGEKIAKVCEMIKLGDKRLGKMNK